MSKRITSLEDRFAASTKRATKHAISSDGIMTVEEKQRLLPKPVTFAVRGVWSADGKDKTVKARTLEEAILKVSS